MVIGVLAIQADRIQRISPARMTFHMQMLSFQSPFEANEIWLICKDTCFKQKVNHNRKL